MCVDSWRGFPYCPISRMLITLLPQHKQVELDGRRRVADILRHLGLLPGTVMVIRGDELVTDSDFVEADDAIEIRNVISGG
jgi:sulfur carrier protein ThiS